MGKKTTSRGKLIGLLLSIVFLCQVAAPAFANPYGAAESTPTPSRTSEAALFSDMVTEDSWSYDALMTAVETGLLRGDNGEIRPLGRLTRAEMVTIVLRALGLDDSQGRDLAPFKTDIGRFVDVPTHAWYYDEIAMAYKLKLLNGTSEDEISPDGTVSREQALVILCRALGFDTSAADESALTRFNDAGALSPWARSSVAVMAAKGYVNGSGGAIYPLTALTRQEFAQIMYNVFGSNYITSQESADALSGKKIAGNIAVSVEGITLSRLVVVDGDVIVGDGVGDGTVVLDGVTIGGRLVVRGGGQNTVYLKNTVMGSVVIAKLSDGSIRVHGDDGSQVPFMNIPDGNDAIVVECDVAALSIAGSDLDVTLSGRIENLTVSGDNVTISGGGNARAVSLERGVSSIAISLEHATIVNNTGEVVTVTGKDGLSRIIAASETITMENTAAEGDDSEPAKYSVNFHSDGGGDFGPVTLYDGGTLGRLPLPYKENMIFLGWFTDSGTSADEVTEDTPIKSNTDLYACYLPCTAPDEVNERTTTSVMDVDPDYSVAVLSSDASMSAEEVKAEITIDPLTEDDEEFGGITVTGGGGSYVVSATHGYTPGCSYALTLAAGSNLTFLGKESTVRNYNITVKMPDPVLNLQLDDSVKAIPVEHISDVTENGAAVASIYAPLLDLDGEPVDEISGTFVYSGDLVLFLGDKLAIYEGTPPNEREAGTDYSEQHIAYVNVTGVDDDVISYGNADASEVVFAPDVLPVDAEDDEDGDTTDFSITIDISKMTYTDERLAEMGLGPSTVVEAGDYLAFYEGEGLFDEGASLIGYANIESVTVSGEHYVIAYNPVTDEELRAAMDMAGSRTLDYDQLSENTDIAELEEDLSQQFAENGFADAASGYLIALANTDAETREQVISGLGVKNFGATVGEAPMLMAASSSPSISVSATVSNDLEHFGGNNGLRCDVTVTCAVAIGDNLSLTITGTFEQEIKISLDISSHAVWKVWGIFPYIADYQITASLDVYNYTGLKLNALLASDDGSEDLNIKESIQSLQDPGSGTSEQKSGAVRRFYEIYQDMIAQDHDYFPLFSVPLFKITGYVDPLCVIAYGLEAEFVVSLDVDIALGAEFGYEKAKRFSVTLKLFKKTATTSQTDLIDENYGFIVYAMGTLGVRAGVKLTVEVGLLSVDLDSIGFSAEVGGYWRVWGFVYYRLEHKNGETTSDYGGAVYMELGVYLEVDFEAQLGGGGLSYVATLYEQEWPLLTVGDRYYVFDFQYELDDSSDDIVLKDITAYQLPWSIFRVLRMDLYTGVISEKGYGPGDFTLALQNDGYRSFTIYTTGLLTITPPYFHKTQAKLTVTWKGGPMAFTSKPISRTFDIKWDDLEDSYAIHFEPNGGACVNSISAGYGASVTLPVPYLAGYTFDGWYLDNGTFAKGYNTNFMPDSNPTLYAKWTPAQVPYTVLYRFQRLDGSWYTDWSVSYVRRAFTGTDVAPLIVAGGVTGFITPAVPVDGNGKIVVAADGSTTVELSYVRNTYRMTYKPNNGDDDVVVLAKCLSQPQEPSFIKPGWTFGGWFSDDGTFNDRYYSFWQMPAHDVTVYAKWSHDTYNITYDLQGGDFGGDPDPNPEIYYGDSAEFSLINPVKAGYLFLAWTGTGLSAPTKNVTIPAGSTGNRYYTAQWQGDYSISYNLAGGSIAGSNPTSYNLETPGFTLVNPTRDGYIFAGWTGTGLSAPSPEVTIPQGSTGNRQYTATWIQIVDYSVRHLVETAYANGWSTGYEIAETETLSGAAGSQTAAVAKTYEGHTSNPVTQEIVAANGTTEVDILYELTRYNATFDPGAGTGGGVVSVKQSTSMALISYPSVSRAGYDFNGWSPSIPTVMPAQNVTYTAKWTPHYYSITYDLIGGTVAGSNPASYSIETAGFVLTNPTRYGYVFAGWTGTGIDQPAMDVTVPTGSVGNRQYVATWTEDTSDAYYTLTFWSDYPSGTQVGYTQRLLEGDAITAPSPARTGYQVCGWYSGEDWQTDPDGLYAVIVDDKLYYQWDMSSEVTMPDHDLTLYADWESNTYTVVLHANGAVISGWRINLGTGMLEDYDTPVEIDPLACSYGSPAQLPMDHIYSDDGEYVEVVLEHGTTVVFDGVRYELARWNTKANGTGTSYERGDFVLNLTEVSGGEVTLYAQWLPVDEFGVFDALYSVVGQVFGYDSDADTVQNAVYDASTAEKPELNLITLGFDAWRSGYFRVRKTGDSNTPFALYMYDPDGRPYVSRIPEDAWRAACSLAPEGSRIGSGENCLLTLTCMQSLENLYGGNWAKGLMTVGNITKFGRMRDTALDDTGDGYAYGFVFTSVNGVSYFICGMGSYSDGAAHVYQVTKTNPTPEEIDAVQNYKSGPNTPGG